jgi:hypothetical protein
MILNVIVILSGTYYWFYSIGQQLVDEVVIVVNASLAHYVIVSLGEHAGPRNGETVEVCLRKVTHSYYVS